MSASETNIEKQKKRHRGPLTGMAMVIIWAVLLFSGFITWLAYQSDNPTAESPAAIVSE